MKESKKALAALRTALRPALKDPGAITDEDIDRIEALAYKANAALKADGAIPATTQIRRA